MASSAPINEFNAAIKASGVWDAWMRANGIDTTPGRPIKLSDAQRKSFQRYLQTQGAVFPGGVEIDSSGNMNENEGFGKQLKKWGPLAAGIAVTMFGIPGTPIGGLLGGGGAAAGGANGAVSGIDKAVGAMSAGGNTAAAQAANWGATALKYGLQYGLPVAGSLIGGKMVANAERESNRALMDYYDKALEAEKEERDYRRGWDEEGRRYGRYGDQYGRESDEEKLRYGRATDMYGRISDEEKLAYDRSQAIRDKNYGYQQYGNFVETLEPFRASGAAATSRMSGLVGGPTPASTGSYLNLANTARQSVQAIPTVPDRPTWNYTPNRPTWNYDERQAGSGQTQDAAANAPVSTTMPVDRPSLITMVSPDGESRQVPETLVRTLEQMGARRVS